jgi:predicted HTH transcriptional regulator
MIDTNRLMEIVKSGESLDREFKSDRRMINDREICEEVVAFANT